MDELFQKLVIDDKKSESTQTSNSPKNQPSQNIHKISKSKSTPEFKWISWSSKSAGILFKSPNTGVGDGEQKVAAELDTKQLGQNSNYDMVIIIDGVEYKCDVKKLDNNTFNTGVSGNNALRVIKIKLTELLNSFQNISNSTLLDIKNIKLLQSLENINSDELCVSNIQKIYTLCNSLNVAWQNLISTLPQVEPFMKIGGDIVKMNLFEYYKICNILNYDIPAEFASFTDILVLLDELSHDYIKQPDKLQKSFDELVSIFSGMKFIFVDEKNGYCIFDDMSKIKFERITRGRPRFRVVV